VEVKLRLPDRAAHDAVAAALAPALKATHHQENYFFDGPSGELSSRRGVLRLRFYNTDARALITLKGEQKLEGGVGRGSEHECDAPDPVKARVFLKDPSQLLTVAGDPIDRVKRDYGVTSLVSLGGFANVRKDFAFEGHTLELDETQFEWGTVYEIEIESATPDVLLAKVEALLKERGIPFKHGTTTKFANFVNKTLE
jgi:adenylate cyclase class IV